MPTCPKCDSQDVVFEEQQGVKFLLCKACGYDESVMYEVYSSERSTQREKRKHSPYRTGGGQRTRRAN